MANMNCLFANYYPQNSDLLKKYAESIKEFAQKHEVLPGIVVAILQKENKLSYKSTLNSLRTKYIIKPRKDIFLST